ncbi:MAG: M55 family metallopeptidase [Candidatus Firestonebacteria bacterium]
MKIYMIVDLEGISGIVSFDKQAHPGGMDYGIARELMLGDVNAAIEGALEGGAKEIVIYDMHCEGLNLILNKVLYPAKVILGRPYSSLSQRLLDKTYDGLFLVGFHSMAETPGGLLTHTYSLDIKEMRLNNKPIGEIGIEASIVGEMNIPTLMVCGDSKAIEETKKILPKTVTAIVKKAISDSAGMSFPIEESRERIRKAAKLGIIQAKKIKPLVTKKPVKIEIIFKTPEIIKDISLPKKAQKVSEKEIIIRGNNLYSAWNTYLMLDKNIQEKKNEK